MRIRAIVGGRPLWKVTLDNNLKEVREWVMSISSPNSGIGKVEARGREMWSRQKAQQGQSSEVKKCPGFTFTLS